MKKRIMTVLVAAMLLLLPMGTVNAAEQASGMSLLEAAQDVDVYETPDGAITGQLPAGTAVLTLGKEENGWVQVMYQEITGYVKLEQMKAFGDTQALDNEYANTENIHRLAFEEMKVQEEQQKQEMLWGAIIIFLIAAIFATSILSAVKKMDEEKKYKPIYKGNKKAER